MEALDTSKLPAEVRDKLAVLDLELSEGDITQKGYDKKKNLLLGPFLQAQLNGNKPAASPQTRAKRRNQRRLTKDESRYHSEIRAEAVQQALSQWKREDKNILQPIKRGATQRRTSTDQQPLAQLQRRRKTASDSSSDEDDSLFGSTGRNKSAKNSLQKKKEKTPTPQTRIVDQAPPSNGRTSGTPKKNDADRMPSFMCPPPDLTSSAAEAVMRRATEKQQEREQRQHAMLESAISAAVKESQKKEGKDEDEHNYQNVVIGENTEDLIVPPPPFPRTTSSTLENKSIGVEDAVYANTQTTTTTTDSGNCPDYQNAIIPLKPVKVSLKIQQLLHSLQRPKKKPLHEYYNDDDAELEALAKVVDPSAPRPQGALIIPARGEHPSNTQPSTLPRSVDSALHRYGTTLPKATVGVVLDHAGKPSTSLTYGKLLSRANKVAYMLLNKVISTGTGKDAIKAPLCKPGDRVALVYPNTEPLSFLTAFYGCLLAGVVPVPVEVPLTKRDAGIQQLGFLLGSCGARVALTSEQCYKGLPKASETNGSTSSSSHDVIDFKGWPRLHWAITEHLSKPSKDWNVPPRLADDSVAYIEYTTDKEGAVKGVSVSRQAMLSHCRAIAQAMGYKEGETIVCVLDFKREVGLWHAILTSVFKGMRVIFVPYSLMKINPTSWMMMVTKVQAQTALLKSRDLHWSLLASKEHNNVNLTSLHSIIVADGANPWSLSSCDQFQQTFRLKPSVLCPCAGSSETGTVALRRPNEKSSGRGVLSMSALSHSVVIVEQENALTSLTLQDAGQVIPGGVAVVVKLFGLPRLCKTDEVGEICIHANSTGSGYWGLEGVSASTFKVEPLGIDDKPLGPVQYVRSGLIGFLGPEGLIFVIGNKSSLMNVSGRQHSADDLIATVLAVEPMRFIYRGRMAVFSVRVLRDERICIIAEQKPDVAEEDAFNWMSRVLQAIDTIHQVGVYCLALVQPNQLPKTPLGGIHVSETKQRFLEGSLNPTTLLMCPHSCVINLPKPREQQSDVGPAAMFVGNIVQGVRIADAKGRELPMSEDEKYCHLFDVLKQRALQHPDHVLYTLMNSKGLEVDTVTCAALLKKAERIAALLLDKGHLSQGDHVALIFPPGIDLIAAFYGCQAAGLVPVCIRPPHAQTLQSTLPTVRMVVDVSKAVALLSTSSMIKLLKCKEAAHRVDIKAWPLILDVEDVPSSSAARRRHALEQIERRPADPCYLDFSVSTTGQLAGIVVSSQGAVTMCKSLKMACELYPSRHITLCLDPYCGLGFALWCLSSVYSGHHTLLIPPADVEANPSLWLQTVSQQKVRDTFCSYGVMDLCVRELATQVSQLKEKGINLSCLRTCVVVAEERPRVSLCSTFSKLFSPLGLSPRAVSTSFGCRVNIAICMQGASSPDPATVYVDARALRNDRVTLVEKGAPHSIALMESGKLLPGVKVVIANPETKGQCADSHLGEIWVSAGHNAEGYFSIFGEEAHLHTDHFNARLKTGDTKTRYARTGYLGFLRQTQAITADGELHDAVFVVGALDETMMLRGMRYHPVDIEVTVIRSHRKIGECAVFTWTHLLVVVAETAGSESEALDLVPAITSAVLEEHHLIVGVVVIVDPGIVPINSRGEKQRMHLRDAFLKDQLDPIYVAYNM